MRMLAAGLLLLFFSRPVLGLEVQLNSQGLSAIESAAAQELIKKAVALLPPTFKDRLDKKVFLSFSNISAHGQTQKDRIEIAKSLLPYILPGENQNIPNTTTRSHHKTYYAIALGTVLHELAHQYDFYSLKNLPERETRLECLRLATDSRGKDKAVLPNYCTWNLYRYNISDNPLFLYSLNWAAKEMAHQTILEEDDATNRSPNPYEFKSPQEAFAVNFEFYLMDPEFQCRRPTAYKFLQKHFNFTPHANSGCQVGNYVMTMMSTSTSTSYTFESIDPKRVAAVHYLLAGDGEAAMSMWGHSMLRLVICAPYRTEVGPECLKDIAYHRVISYRAGVTDLALDTWKGLSGGYPSQVFIVPLLNIINEYTKLEMRELFSYPLKLTRAQIEDFVTRSTEQYWSYRGKYYFASNNCAVETFKLLKMVNPENTDFASERAVTPKGVRDLILSKGYGERLSEDEIKKSTLLYWPSKKAYFQKQVDDLNRAAGTHFKSAQEFLALQPSAHEPILNQLLQTRSSLAPFFVLELLKLESMTLFKNKKLLDEESKKQDSEMLNTLKEKLKEFGGFVGTHYKGTYGIPFDQEVNLVKEGLKEKSQQDIELNQALEKQAKALALKVLGEKFMKEIELSKQLLMKTTDAIKKNK